MNTKIGELIEHTIYRGTRRLTMPVGYRYLMAGNGLFIQAGSKLMDVVQPIAPIEVRGLEPLTPRVVLHYQRVPGRLLLTVLLDAQKYPQREVAYQIRLVHHRGKRVYRALRLAVGSAGAVKFNDNGNNDPVLVELHSHHRMGAFFSNTDNADEQDFRYYVVLGRLDQAQPQVMGRMGIYGYHVPVGLGEIFDLTAVRDTFIEVPYGND